MIVSEEYRFRCVGCGKCCDSPPQLSIREMFSLIDEFVVEASLLCRPTSIPSSMRAKTAGFHADLAVMTSARAMELGGVVIGSSGTGFKSDMQLVLTLSANVVRHSHVARCPALLGDNRCGIYEKRPSVCRYVPGQHLLHADQQHKALAVFKSMHTNDCDWSDDAPVLVSGGRIVQPAMLEGFAQAEADETADGELLRRLLTEDPMAWGEGWETSMSEMLDEAKQSVEAVVPVAIFTLFLTSLRRSGKLPKEYEIPSAAEVATRQNAVCARLIDENIKAKHSSSKPHTERLRVIQNLNKAIISGA